MNTASTRPESTTRKSFAYNEKLKIDPDDLKCDTQHLSTNIQSAVNDTTTMARRVMVDWDTQDLHVVVFDTQDIGPYCDHALLNEMFRYPAVQNLLRRCKIPRLKCGGSDIGITLNW